jgi:hypothetical protein
MIAAPVGVPGQAFSASRFALDPSGVQRAGGEIMMRGDRAQQRQVGRQSGDQRPVESAARNAMTASARSSAWTQSFAIIGS